MPRGRRICRRQTLPVRAVDRQGLARLPARSPAAWRHEGSAMEAMAHRVGIETQLRQVGVTEKDLDQLSSDAMLQTRLLGNNPREVSREDARAIYAAAL